MSSLTYANNLTGALLEDDSEEKTETTDMIIFEGITSGIGTTEDVDSTDHPTDSASDTINHVYLTKSHGT